MDMTALNNALCNPLPEVKNIRKNPHFARLLENDVSGINGEVTAVMQYCYQSFVVEQYEEEIYSILEKIARNEMLHMEALSKAVIKLGGNAAYNGGNGRFWNASFVNYTGNLIAMMNADIAGEKQAIESYMLRMRQTDEPELRALLSRIIEDERAHLSLFEQIRCWTADRRNIRMN